MHIQYLGIDLLLSARHIYVQICGCLRISTRSTVSKVESQISDRHTHCS